MTPSAPATTSPTRRCAFCANDATPGRRLCDTCRGVDVVLPTKPPEAKPFRHVLLGVSPEAQGLPVPGKKKRKEPHNKKPRKRIQCPCGKWIEIAVGAKSNPIFCGSACMKKYFTPTFPSKRIFTPEIDQRIIEVYQQQTGMKAASKGHHPQRALAEELGLPRRSVTRRATILGVLAKIKKESNWSPEEISILIEYAHQSPENIQLRLKRAGYHRSASGIVLKRRRLGGSSVLIRGYSANEVAKLLGIDAHAIMKWIHAGTLEAEQRGTKRIDAQGGDMWLIRPEALRRFVRLSVAQIDFRKVDKYWLVEFLTTPLEDDGNE